MFAWIGTATITLVNSNTTPWVAVPELRRLLWRTIVIIRFTRVFPPPGSQRVVRRHVRQLLVKSDSGDRACVKGLLCQSE